MTRTRLVARRPPVLDETLDDQDEKHFPDQFYSIVSQKGGQDVEGHPVSFERA